MRKFQQGILGSFTGKVGTVTGSNWKGIPVMMGRTNRKRSSVSEGQLQQQAKFKNSSAIRPFNERVAEYQLCPLCQEHVWC